MKRALVWVAILAAGCQEAKENPRKDTSTRTETAPVGAVAGADTAQEAAQRPLWKGDRFPDVELRDLEGNPVRTRDLIPAREALFVFASTTCEACHDLIYTWYQLSKQFPEGYPVHVIVDEEVDLAREFKKRLDFPFPLYCDTESVFYTEYFVDSYPTVAGVGADGTVLFMVRRASPLVTPEVALHMFLDAKGEHKH
jgi:peroxiredoxin